MTAKRASLPRSVVLVGWVSFWADVSSEMAYPLLPLLVVGTLAAPRAVLGLVEGAAVLAVAIMQYWSGVRSDRTGRRVSLIRWGYGLPVVGKALVAGAIGWPMVLVGRVVDRVGKGVRNSPRDALIADAVGARDRGRAFGLHRAMDNAGAFLGVLASAVLLWWLDSTGAHGDGPLASVRVVMAVAAGAALIAFACTFLLREPAHAQPRQPRASTDPRPLPRRFWVALALLALFGLSNASDAFLLLRIHETDWPAWVVAAAYGTYMFTAAVFAYPAGLLSDRRGRWPVLAFGWAVYAGVYFGFAFAPPAALWPLLALYGVSIALTEGVAKAVIADIVPTGQRGRAMGVFGLVNGLAVLAGSLLSGWLWDAVSPAAAFAVPGAIAGLAAVLATIMPTVLGADGAGPSAAVGDEA
jgi:MFS family permease